jgi:poly(hydroxyalkanoate) granule-associated protein
MGKNRKKGQQPSDTSSDRLALHVRDIWLAGLGALERARKEGAEGFETLVARGADVRRRGGEAVEGALAQLDDARQEAAASGRKARNRVKKAAKAARRQLEGAVAAALRKSGVPTRAEVKALAKQVRALEKRLARARRAVAEPASHPRFRVAPHDGGWSVEQDGKATNGKRYGTKKEALAAGRRLARTHAPSHLVVLRADGSEQETVAYGG